MAEKRMTIYDYAAEYKSWESLVKERMSDENGDPRELSQVDKEFLMECFQKIAGNIEQKMTNIYYVYRNMEAESNIAEAERGVFKAEYDRLGKRAKARENNAKGIKGLIGYIMSVMKLPKIETPVFTAQFQKTQKSVQPIDGFFDPDLIPVEFLDRYISPSKVKDAIKTGRLYDKYESYTDEEKKKNPLDRGKLFYRDDSGEHELKYVTYLGGETLFIR